MVKLIVNGEEREIDAKNYRNFGELLDEIKKEQEGKVLAKLVINGNDIPISRIDELLRATLDEEGLTIEMEFKPMKEFLIDTLEEVIKYVDNVINLLPKVSENMIVDTDRGYKAIKDLTDGLTAVENLRENTVKVSRITPKDVGMESREDEVVEILKKFADGLEKRDIIDLSDIIEGQLPKVLNYYKEYFTKVLEILKSRVS